MTESQREKIEAAARVEVDKRTWPSRAEVHAAEEVYIAGAEFALKMVEEELKNKIDEVCDAHEAEWSRESGGNEDDT